MIFCETITYFNQIHSFDEFFSKIYETKDCNLEKTLCNTFQSIFEIMPVINSIDITLFSPQKPNEIYCKVRHYGYIGMILII